MPDRNGATSRSTSQGPDTLGSTSLSAAQRAASAAAERFVAAVDASYDERTDLIEDLRVTAAQLDAAEQAVLDAPGSYIGADGHTYFDLFATDEEADQ